MAKKRVRCPSWLSKAGKKEWRRVVPELFDVGLATGLDQALLAAYCEEYATMIECAAYIQGQGGIAAYLEGKNSQTQPHLSALTSSRKFIKAVAAKFKLNPSQRAEMVLRRKKDKNLDW